MFLTGHSAITVHKKSVDRREEMDYKFLPLSSSKAGFEHGIKKGPGGAPCRKHTNPIELIFGGIFIFH